MRGIFCRDVLYIWSLHLGLARKNGYTECCWQIFGLENKNWGAKIFFPVPSLISSCPRVLSKYRRVLVPSLRNGERKK